MKKIHTICILLMLTILLVACGSYGRESKKEDKKVESKKEAESKERESKNNESKDESSEKTDSNSEEFIDNKEYSITVEEIDEDAYQSGSITILIKNKSKDKKYKFYAKDVTVNGVKVDPILNADVPAGEEKKGTIIIETNKDCELGRFGDVEITIMAYTGLQNGLNEFLPDETLHIYPYGKENATKFEYKLKDTDKILVDNEYVTVAYLGCDPEYIGGYEVFLYINNKTDTDLRIEGGDTSINSIESLKLMPGYNEILRKEACTFSTMRWSFIQLEAVEIDKSSISDIEVKLDIYDNNNSNREHFFNERVRIEP